MPVVNAPYIIQVAPHALRQWSQLSLRAQKKLMKFFITLQINPRPPGAEKVEGLTGLYSQEVNELRVVYKILEQEIIILIIK